MRRIGIAYAREEHTVGIVGIGIAATIDGRLAGSFSVAIPMARFDTDVERRTVELLGRAADMLAGEDAVAA